VCLSGTSYPEVLAAPVPPPATEHGSTGDKWRPRLPVKVYDYAQVPSSVIGPAEREAGRILIEAGINLNWLTCRVASSQEPIAPACQEGGRRGLILRIAPHGAGSLGSLALGFTQPDPGGAAYVTILYSRVRELVRNHVASEHKILGHAIAHEIGHALLNSRTHSATGLMRAQWSASDWRLADVEQLRFSRQEAAAMRSEVVRRAELELPH